MKPALVGIRAVRFKSRLTRGDLMLRRYSLKDVGSLHRLFAHYNDSTVQFRGPRFFFWIWLHRTFQWIYTIRLPTGRATRIIGFIGLYGMESTRRVNLSIALFDPGDRAHGYGRRALELLLDDFKNRSIAMEVRVEVTADNAASLAFFEKLGFERIHDGPRGHVLRLAPNQKG